MKYHIEIYHPGSEEEVLTIIKSKEPFMALNVGDAVNAPAVGDAMLKFIGSDLDLNNIFNEKV